MADLSIAQSTRSIGMCRYPSAPPHQRKRNVVQGLGYFPEFRAGGCDLGLLLRLGVVVPAWRGAGWLRAWLRAARRWPARAAGVPGQRHPGLLALRSSSGLGLPATRAGLLLQRSTGLVRRPGDRPGRAAQGEARGGPRRSCGLALPPRGGCQAPVTGVLRVCAGQAASAGMAARPAATPGSQLVPCTVRE